MTRRGLWAGVLLLALAATSAAAQAVPPRAELPIRPVILSDQTRRYAVPVTVAGVALEAGLDSGSTGLRLMPGALGAAAPSGGRDAAPYRFAAGVELHGRVVRAPVAFGALSGPVEVELVQSLSCSSDKPHCPATRIPGERFGIQGDGLPGEGFKALLGVNTARADAQNPLQAIGARRWIVDLPRPGEDAGRLVLNPTDAETEGYVFLPTAARYADQHGGLHDAVAGCLAQTAGPARACGALLMDTGAPGISVHNGKLGGAPWPDGTPAALLFGDGSGKTRAAESLTIGQRAQASHLGYEQDGQGDTVIYAGLAPYFAFSVLYDPEHGRIGLKPRPAASGGPQGVLAP